MSNTRWQIESMLAAVVSLFALLLAACPLARAQPKSEQLAQQSAEAWLALVDSGNYGESWEQTAQFFKAAVSKEQWQRALGASREPLGKLLSRKVRSATFTKTLPGAPDGEYVVITFESSFDHKQSAVETVTPMLDKDGKWRISGYYIK